MSGFAEDYLIVISGDNFSQQKWMNFVCREKKDLDVFVFIGCFLICSFVLNLL